ncbi:hypothetical protein [Streptomyces sp. NBC_00239]|uniref:hypothetical protein n=1 Tax=Streptomyces sp. NBC_00239 TaxID=2903640 RepID=UPI002E2CF28A|nr:hypothetical protein [Streptomyces sp. NBC_00239]
MTLLPPAPCRPAVPAYTPVAHAERWDIRLARTLLADRGELRDLDADDASGTGYFLGADGWRVQAVWIQNNSLTLPRAGTAARRQWDAALDHIECALASAEFTALRRNRYCVSAAAVVPEEPQSTARLRRVGPLDAFRSEVAFDGYGARTASGTVVLASHGASPTSTLILTDASGTEVGRGYDSHRHAIESLAHHYGLPMPLTVIDEGRRT